VDIPYDLSNAAMSCVVASRWMAGTRSVSSGYRIGVYGYGAATDDAVAKEFKHPCASLACTGVKGGAELP